MIRATHTLLLVKYLYILLISFICSTNGIEPLIFNPYTKDVLNVRGMYIYKSGFSAYVAACPALEVGYQKNFNEKYSVYDKSLLARGEKYKDYEDVKKIDCEKGFELSIAYSHLPKGYHALKLGYEVFYDKSEFPNFPEMEFFAYGKISALIASFFGRVGKAFSRIRSPKMGPHRQEMGFLWFTKIQVDYDVKFWTMKMLNYKLHRHADQIKQQVKCENYNLGKELYGEEKLDDFYSLENQKNIFNGVELPQSTLLKSDCQSKRRCVEKYNFVPPYVFQSSPSSPVSCTNLTTVPIWHEVSKPLLEQLDKFLVSMAQHTDRRFVIIPGVHGKLTLPTTGGNASKEMYLDSSKSRIPIPKILYKLVRYRSYPCDLKETTCVYQVLIAIHNDPNFKEEDRLCVEDKCLAWGWERIQQYYSPTDDQWKKSSHVYCCKVDPALIKKLNMSPEKFKSAGLDLKNFVYDDEYEIVHRVSNRQEQFEEVMDKLFPKDGVVDWTSIPGVNFRWEDNAIPLPEKEGSKNLTPKINMQKIAAERQKPWTLKP